MLLILNYVSPVLKHCILQLFNTGEMNYDKAVHKIPSESQRMAPDTNSEHLPGTPGTPEVVAAPRWPEHSQTTTYAVCS